MPRITTAALSLTALAATAALTACSGSSDASTNASTATPPTHASTTTSDPVPTRAGASDTSSTTHNVTTNQSEQTRAGVSRCAESQLRASVRPLSMEAIHRHAVRLVFTNTSRTRCTLHGFPGAAIVDSADKQVQQAKRVTGGPVAGTVERIATLTIKPGHSVFAYLEGASTKEQGAAQAGCDGPKHPRILVTPPNTRTAVPFTIGWPQCYAFDIHPVREQ